LYNVPLHFLNIKIEVVIAHPGDACRGADTSRGLVQLFVALNVSYILLNIRVNLISNLPEILIISSVVSIQIKKVVCQFLDTAEVEGVDVRMRWGDNVV